LLAKKEIKEYLINPSLEGELFKTADETRKKYCKDEVHVRGVIHFSNYCVRNDLYCGLRKDNSKMKRFRMDEKTVVSLARELIEKHSLKTIVLQAGEDPFYDERKICEIIENIKKNHEVAITLSLGIRKFHEYKAFKNAGADRYLMKHETMNEKLFEKMCPGRTLKERLKHIEYLRKIGFQTGTGNIVGLPGQSVEDLAEDILFFQSFQPDMVNVGPFLPHPQTPLKNYPKGNFEVMLRVFALTRIVTKNTHLAAANTVATLNPEKGQYLCFVKGGANVLMPNCNPFEKSKKEKIEFEFQCAPQKRYVSVEEAIRIIKQANRTISNNYGHSLKRSV
jgi:biotin synthase